MIKISLLPPFLHAEAELLPRRQEIHRLPRRQHLHYLPHRAQPQPVRFPENLRHRAAVLVQRRLQIRASAAARRHRDRRDGVVEQVLLQGGEARREVPLLPDRPPLQVVHHRQLARRQLPQAPESDAVEELGELGLDLEAAEGVDEADVGGGAAAADPQHRPLEGGAPRGGEVGRHVSARHEIALLRVLLEVGHDLLDESTQFDVAGAPGRRLVQLGQLLFLEAHPFLVVAGFFALIACCHSLSLSRILWRCEGKWDWNQFYPDRVELVELEQSINVCVLNERVMNWSFFGALLTIFIYWCNVYLCGRRQSFHSISPFQGLVFFLAFVLILRYFSAPDDAVLF